MTPPRPWTDADLDQLRDLWPGATVREIARQVGRSEEAIRNRGHKLGLPPTRVRAKK